jgi:hypothetical protein
VRAGCRCSCLCVRSIAHVWRPGDDAVAAQTHGIDVQLRERTRKRFVLSCYGCGCSSSCFQVEVRAAVGALHSRQQPSTRRWQFSFHRQ